MTDNGLSATSFLSLVTLPPSTLSSKSHELQRITGARLHQKRETTTHGEEWRRAKGRVVPADEPSWESPCEPGSLSPRGAKNEWTQEGEARGRTRTCCIGPGPLNNVAVDGARELDGSLRDGEPNVSVCRG